MFENADLYWTNWRKHYFDPFQVTAPDIPGPKKSAQLCTDVVQL